MNKFMKAAILEAQKGIRNSEGGPFGCVIVKDNKIIARGHNEVLKKKDATCHGEIVTLKRAYKKLGTYDLSECEIYSTAEPCIMCLGAILWSNISKIYYGCNVKDTEDIGFRDNKFYEMDKKTLLNNIDREECLKLFNEYKSIKDRVIY